MAIYCLLVFIILSYCHVTNAYPTSEHGIILDAGSSSTKIRIYSWPEQIDGVPTFNEVYYEKVPPGISAFLDNVSEIPAYIEAIFQKLRDEIPETLWPVTPVYFLATAGR